jgi:hypothetical protein
MRLITHQQPDLLAFVQGGRVNAIALIGDKEDGGMLRGGSAEGRDLLFGVSLS